MLLMVVGEFNKIENIVDEFECCAREGDEVDYEDIENAAECLIKKIAYASFCGYRLFTRFPVDFYLLEVKYVWYN